MSAEGVGLYEGVWMLACDVTRKDPKYIGLLEIRDIVGMAFWHQGDIRLENYMVDSTGGGLRDQAKL
ncbi:hypothetical protein I7I53_07498 [Histoplasma capsulatum var. duboisii H88]|uniref:Uncharacterized protein n=1 Tax=Ajellomyces capsulatus (strain H88) TaxID=544711 RepID=A0A8A1LGE8_AJEC8|nr:hypothetical protein I7I53_07498 [Histoplasma capsulatum var. duboisii H88]